MQAIGRGAVGNPHRVGDLGDGFDIPVAGFYGNSHGGSVYEERFIPVDGYMHLVPAYDSINGTNVCAFPATPACIPANFPRRC